MATLTAQAHLLTQWSGLEICSKDSHHSNNRSHRSHGRNINNSSRGSSRERKSRSKRLEATGTTPGKTTSELFSEPDSARALRWNERRRDISSHGQFMETADNDALHAYILVHTGGEPRSIVNWCCGTGLEAWHKFDEQYRSRDGVESSWRNAESLATNEQNRNQGFTSSAGKMGRRDQKHDEITGAAMLNEATKQVIVTEHLKLNADRYYTYAQMKWQMVSHVNLKLPSQPTHMWIDRVEQGDDDDQEHWNIDNLRRRRRGQGRIPRTNACGVKRLDTVQANAARRQQISDRSNTLKKHVHIRCMCFGRCRGEQEGCKHERDEQITMMPVSDLTWRS